MMVTIDASVWVSALRPSEIAYPESWASLQTIQQHEIAVICPTLVLAESAAAIVRSTQEPQLGLNTIQRLWHFPGLRLISLSPLLAKRAAEIAVEFRLRGADAIYVAVAEEYSTELITLDKEMLVRVTGRCLVMTPKVFLESARKHYLIKMN